jgi:hypothetical protein
MLNPFSNRKLLKRGERAEARIVAMTQPENGPEPSNVEMTLEVSFRGVPYEVRDRWMVAGTEPIGPGSQIWVAVDPENRDRVAIDWRKTRADYRERTDPRRKVLSAGVPVPVTKVRDVLEQANGARRRQAESPPPAEPDPEPEEPEPAEPDPVEVPIEAPKPREPDPEPAMTRHERDLRAQNGSVVTAPPLIKAAAPQPRVPNPSPAPTRRRPADEEDLTSKLERLAALHAAGALTEGEFAAAKAHVLGETS